MQGARYANPEFYQVHPTAIAGADKRRLISESVRSEGGRMWTWKDGKKWYFFEEMYPAYGNLVPRDIASRVIIDIVVNQGLGADGQKCVYLDVSHIDDERLRERLGGVLEIYEKFMGEDPYHNPMKVYPAVHYSMGGLWADYNLMTTIPGLYAAGECNFEYHGANRLGANSLLSCFYDGKVAGPNAAEYVQQTLPSLSDETVANAVKEEEAAFEALLASEGEESAYLIQDEMGTLMEQDVTVVRDNKVLDSALSKLQDLAARTEQTGLRDKGRRANQEAVFARELRDRLVLAQMTVVAARARDESRGAHYKPEFPKRDDENWLKVTLVDHTPDGPKLSYQPVDISLLKPRERRYDIKTH